MSALTTLGQAAALNGVTFLITHIGLHSGPLSTDEIVGAGYTRASISWTVPDVNTTLNGSLVQFGPAGVQWGNITHIGGYTADSGGDLIWMCPLDQSYFVHNGDSIIFAGGTIKMVID